MEAGQYSKDETRETGGIASETSGGVEVMNERE
jgi:hypothetical protein